MTLRGGAKFKGKLTLDSKNNMRNLMNFNASSGKPESLLFHMLLLSMAYKVSAKMVQKNYLSWHWRVIQTCFLFEKWQFLHWQWKSENLQFDGFLLLKVCNVWASKNTEEKCLLVSKQHKEFGEFSRS